ncbi:MAG: hypothetical protein VX403_07950, partial [Planctomycetota bacterium]|nr:hypothetical protein [Planctomycetota bacterium]
MSVFFKRRQPSSPVESARETPDPPTRRSPLDPALEERAVAHGRTFLAHARAGRTGILSKGFWSDKL